jgi:4-hydroxy-3-polyprenylbenzoate decarboxylase
LIKLGARKLMVAKTLSDKAEAECPLDVRQYIDVLEKAGELRRVQTEVDWKFEIGAMSRLVCERSGPAPFFENVKEYPGQKVASVLMGPSKPLHGRTALALGLDKNTPTLELIELIRQRVKGRHKPIDVEKSKAPCKEVILHGKDANLMQFPIPWIKEIDGGRYVGTWCLIITKDPDTGWVNWATYRCMLKDERSFSILLAPTRQHGGGMFKKYEERGEPMPIALVIGADPHSHIAAMSPIAHGICEAEVAGALRGDGVPVVRCETNDLEVPACSEIVIEAEVVPGERTEEGPFGEYTGHAAHRGMTPFARVKCITHRRDPIYTMANMGKPHDDFAPCAMAMTSAVVKNYLEDMGIDEVKSVYYYTPGSAVVAIKPGPGVKRRIVSALQAGPRMLAIGIVFVDVDVDVTSVQDVWWAISSRMNGENYEVIKKVAANMLFPWLTPVQRESHEASIWVMDATFPHNWSPEYRQKHTGIANFENAWSESTRRKILARWKEYGYGDV